MKIKPLTTLVQTQAGFLAEIARGTEQTRALFSNAHILVGFLHPNSQYKPNLPASKLYLAFGQCSVLLSDEQTIELSQGQMLDLTETPTYQIKRVATLGQPAFYAFAGQTRALPETSAPLEPLPKRLAINSLGKRYRKRHEFRTVYIDTKREELEAGVAQFNLSTFTGNMPSGNHRHQTKWEVIIPVYGDLRAVIEGEGEYRVREQEVAFLPPGKAHALQNLNAHPTAHFIELSNLAFDPATPKNDVELLETPLIPRPIN